MLSPTLNAERRKEKFSKMPLEYSQMSSGRQKKLTSKKRKWIFNQNSCQEKLKWHFCSHMSSCSCYATVLTDWICLPDSTSQTFQVSLAMHTNGKSLTEDQWNRWKNWIRFSTFTCWDLMRFHQEHHTILFLLVWMLSQKISEKLFRVLNLKRLEHTSINILWKQRKLPKVKLMFVQQQLLKWLQWLSLLNQVDPNQASKWQVQVW